MIVQGGDVTNEVARNEPQPVHVEDAECTRIGPSATAERPGIARHHKLIPRDVGSIERDPEEFTLAVVDLRIEQYPTLFSIVPVFRHPMVEVFAFFKISA